MAPARAVFKARHESRRLPAREAESPADKVRYDAGNSKSPALRLRRSFGHAGPIEGPDQGPKRGFNEVRLCPEKPLAYRSQVVGNATVCGQSALNYDERLLTHSPNSR